MRRKRMAMTETVDPEVVQPEPPKKSKPKGNGKPVEDTAIVPRGDVDMLMVEAVRSGNIEVMERVMAIRRELKAEAAREAFYASFADLQSELPIIKKTKWVKSETGTKLYAYAPLDAIIKQCGGIIAKHGFSYSIRPMFEDPSESYPLGRVGALCRVFHVAGHVEESPFWIPVKEATRFTNTAQQSGTALTYSKRYSFCPAFGIVTEDDDTDGIIPNEARKGREPVKQPQSTPTAQKAAQKANTAQPERVQLEPAGEGEGIDEKMADGIWQAMKHGTLTMTEFTRRFPKLSRLGEIKESDKRVVLDWIANPVEK